MSCGLLAGRCEHTSFAKENDNKKFNLRFWNGRTVRNSRGIIPLGATATAVAVAVDFGTVMGRMRSPSGARYFAVGAAAVPAWKVSDVQMLSQSAPDPSAAGTM